MKKLNFIILALFFCVNIAFSQVAFSGKEFTVDFSQKNYKYEQKDIVYKSVYGLELKLDILADKNAPQTAPVLLYVHGGDWDKGNKAEIFRPKVEQIIHHATKLNYRVVSIDYRLCRPETPVYCAISDVKDAVRWVKKNGEKYGLDASHIVLMGTSAGAHLSMMATYSSDEEYLGVKSLAEYSSQPTKLIECYGPVEVHRTFRFQTGMTTQIARWFFNKTLYKDFVDISYDFSGLKYPTYRGDLRKYMKKYSVNSIKNPRKVETLILHGTSDFVVQANNARVLRKYLSKNNISHTISLYKKVKHSFVKANDDDMADIINKCEIFLKH